MTTLPKETGGDWGRAGLEPVVQLLSCALREGRYKPDPLVPLQIEPCKKVFENVKRRWEKGLKDSFHFCMPKANSSKP
jgi:hypothetical protein